MSCANVIRERYTPVPIGADTSVIITNNAIGGFLCTTAGTITLVAYAADGKPQTTIFSALAVSAGTFIQLPFYLGKAGGIFTTAGGAVGTIAV